MRFQQSCVQVEDPAFWAEDMQALTFVSVPELQDEILVTGCALPICKLLRGLRGFDNARTIFLKLFLKPQGAHASHAAEQFLTGI